MRSRPHATLAVCLLLVTSVSSARAETVTQEVTVDAGKHDRKNTPVTAALKTPAQAGQTAAVSISAGAGKQVAGQITQPGLMAKDNKGSELHFILPQLEQGKSERLQAKISNEPPATSAGEGYRWQDTPGEYCDLFFGDRPILRYMYRPLDESNKEKREETFKVFHHVYDPAGKQMVTKGPGGLYTHHRGVFYGFNKVTYDENKQIDIWHCRKDEFQSHEGFLVQEAGPVLARQRLALDWHGDKKEVFAKEQREITAYNVPGGTMIEFASRLTPTRGTVKLDGDPQHAGFHFRASNEVADKTKSQTYYLRPDGKGEPGQTRNWPNQKDHVNLPWDAMSFVLGDQRYTMAYLDKPTNPKEARFSERDYGRFGSYFVYEATPEKPLEVNYRLWLQDGEMTDDQAKALSADFVEPPVATVK